MSLQEGQNIQKDQKVGDGRSEKCLRRVVCPICGYLSDRNNNLKRHHHNMHEPLPLSLECCGQRFFTKGDMRTHTRAVHRDGYKCPVCGHVFCRKALLNRHLSVHTGYKPFTCHFCDYQTSNKSNLERHIHAKHNKNKKDTNTSKKDVPPLEEARHTMAPEYKICQGSKSSCDDTEAHQDTHPKSVAGCRRWWPWGWVLPPHYRTAQLSTSQHPPPLLPCPVKSLSQPERPPSSTRKFTIQGILQDSEDAHPAVPSRGELPPTQAHHDDIPASISPPAYSSSRVVRPTPIRPGVVVDMSCHPTDSSIPFQRSPMAVCNASPPMPPVFPLPPAPFPLVPLSITSPHSQPLPQPHTSYFDQTYNTHFSLPPLQSVAKSFPPPSHYLGNASFRETSPLDSSEGDSIPEEQYNATGEEYEYMHKKLRFSRKLLQIEEEQRSSDEQ